MMSGLAAIDMFMWLVGLAMGVASDSLPPARRDMLGASRWHRCNPAECRISQGGVRNRRIPLTEALSLSSGGRRSKRIFPAAGSAGHSARHDPQFGHTGATRKLLDSLDDRRPVQK